MTKLIKKLEEGNFILNFLKFPERNNVLLRAYHLEKQYSSLKERLESVFSENPEVLPEFPIVYGMVRREIFPAISLKEYNSLTDQGIIDIFRNQKKGDHRKGPTQGYMLTGTMEKYLQGELIKYLDAGRMPNISEKYPKKNEFGERYNPRDSLWEAVSIGDRLKPAILNSVTESLINRAREISDLKESKK